MKRLLLVVLGVVAAFCYGQNEKINWHFGPGNTGLKFDLSLGTVSPNNIYYSPFSNCGASVVTQPQSGRIWFYTDGLKVIDSMHAIMPNGSGLLGGSATHSNGFAVPMPGNCKKYYVFTITTATENAATGNLYYSIVDMTLPGNGTVANPRGDVIAGQKNILLFNNVSEGLEVVFNAATNNYWLLVPLNNPSSIRIYSITNTGIAFNNSFALGVNLTDIQATKYNYAYNKYCIGSFIENQPTLLADFNIATGNFTAVTTIPGTPLGSSTSQYAGLVDAEWSADGTKLYLSKYRCQAPTMGSGRIYQYDLNIPGSPPIIIYTPGTTIQSDVCKGMRLGPDNKIYFGYSSSTNPNIYLGCINQPNLAGSSCNVNATQVQFSSSFGGIGLFPRFQLINAAPTSITVSGNTTICAGQSTTLTATGASTYQWSGGITATTSSVTVAPLVTTNYYIKGVTFCDSIIDTITVVVSAPATISVAGNTTVCAGQSTTLTASGNGTFQWSGGSTSTSSSINVSPSVTTSYTVIASNNGCLSAPTSFTVNVLPIPAATINGIATICSGQSTTLTAGGGITYQWSGGNTSTIASILVSPTVTTSYSVTASDGTCPSLPVSITVTVTPTPLPTISGNATICIGQSTTLTASGGTNYQWSGGSTATNASITISPIATTTYSVTASNATCSSVPTTAQVTVLPVPLAILNGTPTICMGQSTTLVASGGTAYQWSSGITSTNTSITVSPTSTTTYSVTASNGICASLPVSITVTVSPLPIPIISGNNTICVGQSALLTASGGTTYQWSGGNTSTSSSITVSPTTSATYSVTSNNGVCTSLPVPITVSVIPLPTLSLNGSATICAGQNITLNGTGATNYNWTGGGINSQANSITVSPTTNTTYYLSAGNVCGTIIDSVTIQILSTVISSFYYLTDSCTNAILFVNTTGTNNSNWNFGDGTISTELNPLHNFETMGTYSVSLTSINANGCTSNSTQVLYTNGKNSYHLYIPNTITPNGDGLNDEFIIFGFTDCEDYQLAIYNRWGEKIFETDTPETVFWNGDNGRTKEVPDGVYYFKLWEQGKERGDNTIGGFITVLR
jgi:gliding motility-associated-like protein